MNYLSSSSCGATLFKYLYPRGVIKVSFPFQDTLKSSALILSVVNGLGLLWNYLRDRPRLKVKAIHPDVYQWYFPLPGGEYEDQGKVWETRRYGFLLYVAILNKGLRDVALNKWRLFPRTKGPGMRGIRPSFYWVQCRPINIPKAEIQLKGADYVKRYPILGQKGELFEGTTMIESGDSISGFAYFTIESYGSGTRYKLDIRSDTVKGLFLAESIFGNTGKKVIEFRRKDLEEIERIVPGIKEVDKTNLEDTPSEDKKIVDPTS